MTETDLPIKKSVSMTWHGSMLSFDVAQDLFSSHQVDRGSRALLESLDPGAFPARGDAADFGCGYGVLGIAWQARFPDWAMHYIDRDALAVAFSRHNVQQLEGRARELASVTCDISLPHRKDGYDLVLWNVPGKAGWPVIGGLLDVVLDSLAPDGVLAAVVVHPLAGLFTGSFGRGDVDVTLVDRGKEHTVVHIQRHGGAVVPRDPFAEGVFDRPEQTFAISDERWELVPVIGLPEYDSLGHSTELAAKSMRGLGSEGSVGRWAVIEPGVGHLAVVASRIWPSSLGMVYSRDALSIRATARAIGEDAALEAQTVWGGQELPGRLGVDLVVAALPEQAQERELAAQLEVFGRVLSDSGIAVLHGRSTEISRIERLIRREERWRAGKVDKLRGSASVVVRRRAP